MRRLDFGVGGGGGVEARAAATAAGGDCSDGVAADCDCGGTVTLAPATGCDVSGVSLSPAFAAAVAAAGQNTNLILYITGEI